MQREKEDPFNCCMETCHIIFFSFYFLIRTCHTNKSAIRPPHLYVATISTSIDTSRVQLFVIAPQKLLFAWCSFCNWLVSSSWKREPNCHVFKITATNRNRYQQKQLEKPSGFDYSLYIQLVGTHGYRFDYSDRNKLSYNHFNNAFWRRDWQKAIFVLY